MTRYFLNRLNPFWEKPDDGGAGAGGSEPNASKTYSEDYVKALREEAKNYRLDLKDARQKLEAFEKKIKEHFGLKGEDSVDNWDTVFETHKQSIQKKIEEATAKNRELILLAKLESIKSKYDEKLFNKLFDKTKVQIDENGNISGLDEYLQELEKEFPMIVKGGSSSGLNPGASDTKNKKKTNAYQSILNARKK